jgi:hypothetical protein
MRVVGESFRRQNAGLFIMLKYLAVGFTYPISIFQSVNESELRGKNE